MKKIVSLILITSFFVTNGLHAKDHHHKNPAATALSGAWQFVKIGGGLFMIGSGLAVGGAVCGCGICLKCCNKNCPLPAAENGENDAQRFKKTGTPTMIGGALIGTGGVFFGIKSIKSGIHGLRKLAHHKSKKDKQHNHHHHITHH